VLPYLYLYKLLLVLCIIFSLNWAKMVSPFGVSFWRIKYPWMWPCDWEQIGGNTRNGFHKEWFCILAKLLVMTYILKYMQVMLLSVLPNSLRGANYAKNVLRAAILVQYIPRLFRFLPMLFGQSPAGFIFESAWANFIINLLIFMLASHVVGSCWYLFALQVSENGIWCLFQKY